MARRSVLVCQGVQVAQAVRAVRVHQVELVDSQSKSEREMELKLEERFSQEFHQYLALRLFLVLHQVQEVLVDLLLQFHKNNTPLIGSH